jgi:hypothetical protein
MSSHGHRESTVASMEGEFTINPMTGTNSNKTDSLSTLLGAEGSEVANQGTRAELSFSDSPIN